MGSINREKPTRRVDLLADSAFWSHASVAFRPVGVDELACAILARIPEACPPGVLIDLGCGDGAFLRAILRNTVRLDPIWSWAGVDICEESLELARAVTPEAVIFEQEDAFAFLQRATERLSVITMTYTTLLGFAANRDAELLTLARDALVPGGVIAIDLATREAVRQMPPCVVREDCVVRMSIDEAGFTHFVFEFAEHICEVTSFIHSPATLQALAEEVGGINCSAETVYIAGQERTLAIMSKAADVRRNSI